MHVRQNTRCSLDCSTGPDTRKWILYNGQTLAVLQTAMELARRLEAHPRIGRVHYPGLPSHPDHRIAKAQMLGGFGGVISFEVRLLQFSPLTRL